jgi:pimeloyl-ACP methyl ester carboxylesterase
LYYETYGEGGMQPLLLIHGNGGSIYSERCQIDYFKDKYFTIVADSRFHGKTENGLETLTYDLMAEDYNFLLDYLEVDSAYIIGQSDGGIIGLILAIKYQDKVKKLVTTSPNLQPDTTALEDWVVEYIENELIKVNNQITLGDTTKDMIRQKEQLSLMYYNPHINKTELSKIKAPVLVMAGDDDEIKLQHIIEIYQNIPQAQLFIMPGATHYMLREEHALFNQIVDRFLDKPFKRPTTRVDD